MHKFVTTWTCAPIILLGLHLPADSQVLSFGARVGVPLTTAYTIVFVPDGGGSTDEIRFLVGPTIEFHLPYRLSFEIDALWRRSSFTSTSAHANLNYKSSVNDWNLPFLLKYAMASGPIGPFVDGGVVYRHVTTVSSSVRPPTNPNTVGASAGGGVTLKVAHLRFSPEIRYTRWPTQAFASGYYSPVTSTANQADLLLGITF
jgi:hypothetical protein